QIPVTPIPSSEDEARPKAGAPAAEIDRIPFDPLAHLLEAQARTGVREGLSGMYSTKTASRILENTRITDNLALSAGRTCVEAQDYARAVLQ
ncbi:MAG: hypothetical protein MK099_09780, partial [Dehalococcoidia bacterium]|nr:hypothetical protein [Dehalococcoidia bacterium]